MPTRTLEEAAVISRALAGRKQTDHIPLANPSGQLGIRQSSEKAGYWRRRERYAHQPDLVMLSASFPIAPEGPVLDSFKVMSRLANSHALVNAAFRPLEPVAPKSHSSPRHQTHLPPSSRLLAHRSYCTPAFQFWGPRQS